jgi:hypothetical protein
MKMVKLHDILLTCNKKNIIYFIHEIGKSAIMINNNCVVSESVTDRDS